MVPLETVRGVYEKLSREAVEAQLTRPLPGRNIQQEPTNIDVHENEYQPNADDLETGSRDVAQVPDDDVSAGKKSMIERTAAWTNGRAVSAPTTPVHRPLTGTDRDVTDRDVTDHDVTDRDVTDDELPQRGLTRALVAQWRELEQRARADVLAGFRAGTSRSRSLSGMALRRGGGGSPSPGRRDEQGQEADDGGDVGGDEIVDEQGPTCVVHQQQQEAGHRGDVDDDGNQLPPPLMTQYMLAKFRDMEAETRIIAGLQAKDRKVTITTTNLRHCGKPWRWLVVAIQPMLFC